MSNTVQLRLANILQTAIAPAAQILPPSMNTPQAQVMLLAIGLQESRFTHRFQVLDGRPGVKGPARGYWQFEQGTRASRGGVWGVFLHPASKFWLAELCKQTGVGFEPTAIYRAIEDNDVLAAGVARLLLFTDPRRLPTIGDVDGSWKYYLRTWRPGKPHEHTWAGLYASAVEAVMGSQA